MPGVGGLLRESAAGLQECSLPGTETDAPALLKFYLPESAHLEQVTPTVVRTSHHLGLDTAADSFGPSTV